MLAKYILIAALATQITAQRRRPNIILMVSDDQDVMLGSLRVMENLRETIMRNGVEFSNAFTTTPICCPSRSSMLTGLYAHNHHVYTNNDNCSSSLWQRHFESRSYANYLNKHGYHTGYFGKYLNEYNGSYTPPGWDYWMGLAKNSKYYNYTLFHNGQKEVHGDNYAEDYLTDLVTNRSIDFFRRSKTENRERPVLAVVSFPAPHGPEDGAPQYRHLYHDDDGYKTKSFDYVPNVDKHWIISRTKQKMDETQLLFSQLLQQKRLQTLRSVDDGVKKIVDMLQEIQELDNTYLLYVSDHGYHIGQFGLPKGKSMPYDFDIRIPFAMSGPGLPRNEKSAKIALNIDVAPTILGMANVPIPPDMDGRNLLDLFNEERLANQAWRDSFLIERGKIPRNKTHLVKPRMKTKAQKLQKLCESPNYAYPCKEGQFWTCAGTGNKRRLQKCKKPVKQKTRVSSGQRRKQMCPCSDKYRSRSENGKRSGYQPTAHRYSRTRGRNGNRPSKRSFNSHMKDSDKRGMLSCSKLWKEERRRRYRRALPMRPNSGTSGGRHSGKRASMVLTSSCRLYMPNFEIRCDEDLYIDPRFRVRSAQLHRSVKTLQLNMKYMRSLKTCLKEYDQIRSNEMCECPPQTLKPKPKVPKMNVSHPLIDENETDEREFHEKQRLYQEQKETKKFLKESRQAKLKRKQIRHSKGGNVKRCGDQGLTCFILSNKTWSVEPRWDGSSQCYCTNANNNTYWCVRIINENTDALYCQFITGFKEYFNLKEGPFQLVSTEMNLQENERMMYQNMIKDLRGCKGSSNCTLPPFVNPFTNVTSTTSTQNLASTATDLNPSPEILHSYATESQDRNFTSNIPDRMSLQSRIDIDSSELPTQRSSRQDQRQHLQSTPSDQVQESKPRERIEEQSEILGETRTRIQNSQEAQSPETSQNTLQSHAQNRREHGRQRNARRGRMGRSRNAKAQKGSRSKKKNKDTLQ